MEQELISKVWHIAGIVGRVTPGLLIWNKGNVTFITQEATEFNEPLSELKDITWPLLRMGFGFDTIVNGKKYRFSFSKPNPSAPELEDTEADQLIRLLDVGRLWDSIKTLSNLKADKATTKEWKEILKG